MSRKIITSGTGNASGKPYKFQLIEEETHYLLIQLMKEEETEVSTIIPQQVRERKPEYSLKQNEDEETAAFTDRKLQLIEIVKQAEEEKTAPIFPAEWKVEFKIVEVTTIQTQTIKTKKIDLVEKGKEIKLPVYFRPMPAQINEIIRNFLKSK